MRRRIQGSIHQRKSNNNDRQTEGKKGISDGEITISKDQLVSGIVSGMAKEKFCPVNEDKLVTEISEELINSVAAKVEERQKQSKQGPDSQKESKQGPAVRQQAKAGESDQRTLQALVAKLLLGEKNQPQNKSSGNNAEAVNPIIAGLDNASRAGAGQSGQQGTAQQIDNLTADTAAQVLAETQYELAKELEASLQKLRKVIEESKQVAQKINDLLGQDGGNKQQN
ncbi:MAG TPA: hypothetical protein VN462_00460 [Negativicutes bacterium]|nr:hypothetical protein [Negativicutes bacterium]